MDLVSNSFDSTTSTNLASLSACLSEPIPTIANIIHTIRVSRDRVKQSHSDLNDYADDTQYITTSLLRHATDHHGHVESLNQTRSPCR